MPDDFAFAVGLLLNGKNAQGADSVADRSYFRRSLTNAGGGVTSQAVVSKYGGSALSFPGANPLVCDHYDKLDFSTTDFTVEGWFRFAAGSTATSRVLITKQTDTGFYPWQIVLVAGVGLVFRGFDSGSTLVFSAESSTTPSTEVWHHIAGTRNGSAFTLWFNGVAIATANYASTLRVASDPLSIGAYSNGLFPFSGHIDDLRLTNVVCRYAGPFTPPGELEVPGVLAARPSPRPYRFPSEFSAAAPVLREHDVFRKLEDRFYGGRGRISGTVEIKGTPTNALVRRRVRLVRESDAICIREVWSDPVTGAYLFEHIDPAEKYSLLTYDYTLDKRAVIADNLTPDPMP